MLQAIPFPADSARYAASLLLLPDLWAPARLWQPMASFLGHRGWEGSLVELRGTGDMAARGAALAGLARVAPAAPVLIGHGAGALVALDAARSCPAVALVLIAPLLPGTRPVRALTRRWEVLAALVRGKPVPPPRGASARRLYGEIPEGLDAESPRAVLDVVRGRARISASPGMPTLVLAGDRDPLLAPDAAARLASALAAERIEIPGAGHWPILAPAWQRTVAAVHRWLVQRLGEPLLDLYSEAMAERDADGPEEE